MNGDPVWLVSMSVPGKLACKWSDATLEREEVGLDFILEGLGDPERERSFVMPVTFCKYRALNEREMRVAAAWIKNRKARHIAGGPFRIFKETEAGAVSTLPCRRARVSFYGDPTLLECGKCDPCMARSALERA